MPMYEYKCKSCGDVTEHLVGVGAEQPEIVCGGCGSDELAQMISIVSVSTGAQPEMCCGGACERESAASQCVGEPGACACGH
jgi:putative FmdB family regulatory protein